MVHEWSDKALNVFLTKTMGGRVKCQVGFTNCEDDT